MRDETFLLQKLRGFVCSGRDEDERETCKQAADLIESQAKHIEILQINNVELKQQNATLRTSPEPIERALRAYVLAQSRMAGRWAEGDEDVKRQLWQDLHACEDAGREALEALGEG